MRDGWQFGAAAGGLGLLAWGLFAWNRRQGRSAVICFEELPEEEIVTLKPVSIV
jgi:hypothetical protein